MKYFAIFPVVFLMATMFARTQAIKDDLEIIPGDVVDVSVFGVADLSGSSRVSGTGYISLPLIGPIKAAGLDLNTLAKNVEDVLKEKAVNDPHVIASIKEFAPQAISVVGSVRNPGTQQVRKPRPL